jgi:hypothetical protein
MATTDVMNKCIAANEIKAGSVVTGVTRTGQYDSIDPKFNLVVSPEAFESRMTERYDTAEELM